MLKSLTALCTTMLLVMPAVAEDVKAGVDLFVTYCASCHGLEARGDGPMSAILTVLPTDLTQLAVQMGGTFPIARVVARIDGRDPLVAHGSPMPVYGEFFEGKGVVLTDEDGVMIMTSQPVIDLVAYLQSVQE